MRGAGVEREGAERGREVDSDRDGWRGEKREKQWSRQFREKVRTCAIGWPAACCLECGSAAAPQIGRAHV